MTELEKYKKAFALFVEWINEAGFGYDELGELYDKYKEEIESKGISYSAGLMYITLRTVEEMSKDGDGYLGMVGETVREVEENL